MCNLQYQGLRQGQLIKKQAVWGRQRVNNAGTAGPKPGVKKRREILLLLILNFDQIWWLSIVVAIMSFTCRKRVIRKATVDPSQPRGKANDETALLQFGKVSDDTFTMNFRRPLSAFQAFAICVTMPKLACE
ncbi:hypothetical protein ACFE04_001487 [Oxalis oulophora]